MPEIESPKFLAEEIKHLEEKLESKRREMAEAGSEFKPEEATKEIIKEYSSQTSQSSLAADQPQLQKAAAKLKDESHSEQIEALMQMTFKEGLLYAINVARRLQNPHLLDDFHDRLVLEFLKTKK